MRRYATVHKEIGETPLQALQTWINQHPKYSKTRASYAGRLDPMASGKLLILLGDECKRQRAYTNLDKEYTLEVLLDIESDTGDILGIPKYTQRISQVDRNALPNIFKKEQGSQRHPYPAFSSKTVNGKPLFLHTLEGTLSLKDMPEHIEHIHRIILHDSYEISGQMVEKKILRLLERVPSTEEPSKRIGENFRVDTIRAHWDTLFKKMPDRNFTVLRLKVICASGTYMRSLANRIGVSLGTNALAYSITRTKIGKYIPLFRGRGFWLYVY